MKLTTISIPFLSLMPSILADFHINNMHSSVILTPGQTQDWDTQVACPSNYWNCNCMTGGDRTGTLSNGSPGDDFFSINAGLCGMGQMNFYKDGDTYRFYENNGDGTQIGTCYYNDEFQECVIPFGVSYTNGGMVCFSYVCS